MLCDQVVQEGRLVGGYEPIKMKPFLDKIRKAHKFVLAPDFAQAADELARDLGQVAKALPFCRLPYPLCWFEVAQVDRPAFKDGLPPDESQGTPVRVGFLMEATRPDLSAWKTHLLWNFADSDKAGCFGAVAAAKMDMLAGPIKHPERDLSLEERNRLGLAPSQPAWVAASDAVKALMTGCFDSVRPDYGAPEAAIGLAIATLGQDHRAIKAISEAYFVNNVRDWAGEIQYIAAMLALLNARNASETKEVDHTAYNRARQKRGRAPLFSHHLLLIHPRQKARMEAVSGGGEHGAVRQHFVRGHWKVRKSGVFFWRPFRRGRLAAGEVHKDYVLTNH